MSTCYFLWAGRNMLNLILDLAMSVQLLYHAGTRTSFLSKQLLIPFACQATWLCFHLSSDSLVPTASAEQGTSPSAPPPHFIPARNWGACWCCGCFSWVQHNQRDQDIESALSHSVEHPYIVAGESWIPARKPVLCYPPLLWSRKWW